MMAVQETKFCCMNDSKKIGGKLFMKEGGTNLPVAVLCHGFMANMIMCFGYAKLLAENGYAAFCFDFIGGGVCCKSDGKTEEMSVLTECDDLQCVISYAKGLAFTDSSHLLLLGCSQGGLVASLVAAQIPDEIEKLILLYPALCLPDDARRGNMLGMKFDPHNIPAILHFGPLKIGRKYVTDAIGMDVYSSIIAYTGKVLIIHGTGDGIVNVSFSRKALECYRKAGADVRLVEIEGGKHAFPIKKHDNIAKDNITEFILEKM